MMRRTPMKRTGFKTKPKQPLRHANCDVIAIAGGKRSDD